MWFYNNVTRAPVAEMAERLSSTSNASYAHSSPEGLGFFERSSPAALQSFMWRSCELMGDAFCVAPEDDVHDMVRDMINKHNTTLPPAEEGKHMTEYMTSPNGLPGSSPKWPKVTDQTNSCNATRFCWNS